MNRAAAPSTRSMRSRTVAISPASSGAIHWRRRANTLGRTPTFIDVAIGSDEPTHPVMRLSLYAGISRERAPGFFLLFPCAFSKPYGNANTTTADVPDPPKNPDTTPDVVATYCLPSIA